MYLPISKSDVKKTITINDNGDVILSLDVSVYIGKNMFASSLNPTYINQTTKNVIYYTTIGLYDDNNELVAVGKVVEPINANEEIVLELKTEYILYKNMEYDTM